jgi:hypothetical protein
MSPIVYPHGKTARLILYFILLYVVDYLIHNIPNKSKNFISINYEL